MFNCIIIGLIILILHLTDFESWRLIPLAIMGLFNVSICVILIVYSYKFKKLKCVSLLILIHLITILALGVTGNEERTLELQWVQQSLNTFNWIIFIIAVVLICKDIERSVKEKIELQTQQQLKTINFFFL